MYILIDNDSNSQVSLVATDLTDLLTDFIIKYIIPLNGISIADIKEQGADYLIAYIEIELNSMDRMKYRSKYAIFNNCLLLDQKRILNHIKSNYKTIINNFNFFYETTI